MFVSVLLVVGALAQLAGLALVSIDVRAARGAARSWLAHSQVITDHGKDFYSHGLGAAEPKGRWALDQVAALQRTLADGAVAQSQRGFWGGLLIAVGIVAVTASSLAA